MRETQDAMRETIQNCFAEMMVTVNGRLDRMQTEINERFAGIEKRLDGIDERLDGIDERLDGMDERFEQIEKRLGGIDEQLKEHSEQLFILDRKLTGLALHVENETDKYVQILAENHLTLTEKLNEGVEAHNGNKLYAIKVNFLISRVDRLYDEVEGIKKQMKIRRPGRRSMKALS